MTSHIAGPLSTDLVGPQQGDALVFLHPNPLDGSSWLFQVAHLQTWYRCLAVDLPGYGRSPGATDGVTLPELAEACWQAVDKAAVDLPVTLVGCSVGSNVALHMARQRPADTDALVLSGASWRPVREYATRRAQQYREQGLAMREQHALDGFSRQFRQTEMGRWLARVMAERNSTTDLASIIAMFEALATSDPPEFEQEIKTPTLIITGSEDAAHQPAFALAERLPRAQLVTLHGAGHACQLEQPWAFNEALLRFLRERA